MSTDTLSAVLRAVRLTGAIYFSVDASSPWVAEAPEGRTIAAHVLPGVQHLIEYHVLTRGACWGGLIGEPPLWLEAGDVIVFPHGDAHVLSSAPGMRAAPDLREYERRSEDTLPFQLEVGGNGPERAHVVCGFLGCDVRPFNPLLATLPRVLHIRAGAEPRDERLSQLVQLALHEAKDKRAGGECMLARISELMFVEVVRRHLQSLPPEQKGWLAGLRDADVGRALGLLRGRPAHPWTLEELARAVGLSRSALAERFTQFVGEPPMQYLAQWRMQVAAGLLSEGSINVARVALEVGYGSEAAFSRAFKKLVGVPPATWRKQRLATSGSA